MERLTTETEAQRGHLFPSLFFQIIDECNTEVGKMRQMEELIQINQSLEFDKLKAGVEMLRCSGGSWHLVDCPLSPGHPDHLPDPILGEEGGAAGNGQRGHALQHEGEVHPRLPLPLQRPARHRC